jgi:hypothetical protein
MAAHKAPTKVDPELERQINSAAAESKTVEAVLMLRQSPTQIAANPDGATTIVEEVLKRVKEKAGTAAKQVNVFQNLGMFIVEAEPSFLRELLAQPEIASAVANQQPAEASSDKPAGRRPRPRK